MKKSWQDYWEEAAQQERRYYESLSTDELLLAIDQGRYGQYYVIWKIIVSRTEFPKLAPYFLKVLKSNIDYLYRMNCAEALLSLLPDCPFSPVDIGGDHTEVKDNVNRLEQIILQAT